jgi:5'-nucleotidase
LALSGVGAVTLPRVASAAVDPASAVIINEVYGGGGNAGAPYLNDFVELYNTSDEAVPLDGWTVQYAAAAGTNWSGSIPLSGTIQPDGYFLVQAASGGANGVALPTPNTPPSSVNMSGTNGNVALVSNATKLLCQTVACQADPSVVDLVGFGTGAAFAGTAAAPAGTNTTSISRTAFANSGNNNLDFTAGAPSPVAGEIPETEDIGLVSIAEIQGTGAASPHAGAIASTQGIVTAAYPTGGLNGFVIQTPGTGGDTDLSARAGSDAIFVYSPATTATVTPGSYVQVKGLISEFGGLTELTVAAGSITDLGAAPAPVAPISAPWPATAADREKIESMLFTPTGTFTVSDTFDTNSFGEVGLATGDTPLRTPTDVARPLTPEYQAVIADNAARGVVLDDGATTSFLSGANTALTPPYISTTNPLRVGETPTFATDVIVDFGNGLWKFQPLAPVTDTNASAFVTFDNTRVAGPDADALGDGSLKIASFNVLNYFTTLGATWAPGCTSFNDRAGNPITDNSCANNGPRGAWDAANLARQQAKIVAAINALDADVVGLMEIENSATLGEAKDEAVGTLVAALNAAAGAPVWAFVPSSTQLPPVAQMDVINNAIIYKPAVLTPVGASVALGDQSDTGEAFANAREPIGQVFKQAGGGDPFLVVVNHFKSKSSGDGPLDADQGDGQGASNYSRTRQADALNTWVQSVQTSAAVDDVFLLGDFNSYTHEDPLQILYDAGYTDLNDHFGDVKQSYNFDGQNGSLDHILANAGALARVTGEDIWNVNAPESIALEYSRYNYHGTIFYDPSPYRASDHDPVVAAFTASDPAPAGTTDITLISINDFHGRIDTNTVKWAGTVEQIVASAGGADVAITGAGDLVSASLFASAVADDQPTIDVMNEIGLDASAVGNHEFDKGWPDLRDRIIDGGNNAEWDYLGANVYAKGTTTPVLPEYSIITINGIRVGVIGAVTEETSALVSPGGITDIEFGDPVEAVNRVAAKLTSEDLADVIVATFHEGAPVGTPGGGTLESNEASSAVFDEIVNNVSPDVDVLFNGHTHQVYAWDGPVPGSTTGQTRPVLQTGSYGDNIGKVVLTVDTTTKDVVSYTATNIPRTTVADAALLAEYPSTLTEVKSTVDAALAYAAVVGNVVIGSVTNDITTAYTGGTYGPTGYQAPRINANRDQRQSESALGDLVANALRDELSSADRGAAEIGVVNPGGLRSELFYPLSGTETADGQVTYAEANSVLPFVNNLWTTSLTGAQFKTMLEQQWQRDASGNVPTRAYLQLGLSDNVTYTFDASLPEGSRITSITIDGVPYDPTASYRIGTFSFLITGGDNFRVFTQGTNARDTGLVDRDVWIDYITANSPLSPDYARQSVGVSPLPTSVTVGSPLQFAVSSLDLTSLGAPANTSLAVSLGGVPLGSVPVVNGAATVDLPVPAGVPGGAQSLVLVATPSGTTVTIPVNVTVPKPPAPVITTPASGAITSDTTPAIGGTAKVGTTVKVVEGAKVLGTAVTGASGSWTLNSVVLSQGVHTITATATDASGTSDPSAAVTFTVDSIAPGRPTITSPALLSVARTASVPVKGQGERGATVTVYADGSAAVGTSVVDTTGKWATSTSALVNGLHVLTAKAQDGAGNTSAASLPVVVLVCDSSVYGGNRPPFLYLLLCGR